MVLSENFYNRLRVEEVVVKKKFPDFKFSVNDSDAYLRGWYTSTVGNDYQLKLVCSEHYPDRIPNLYIISPKILWEHAYTGTINQLEINHQFHTLDNDSSGHIQICHFSSEKWEANCTSIAVIVKGFLWIESYENHLNTGKSINTIIDQWKRSKKWTPKAIDWKQSLTIFQMESIQRTNYFSTTNQSLFDLNRLPRTLMGQ